MKRWISGTGVAAVIVAVAAWQERGSVERANRLFRAGDAGTAAGIYDARARRRASRLLDYNLGTALLGRDPVGAEGRLRSAAGAVDSLLSQRGFYNLGYFFLSEIDPATAPDSAIQLLLAAIGSNRAALRRAPGDENARWNLALAQRMLDSLGPSPAGGTGVNPSEQQPSIPSDQQLATAEIQTSGEARASSTEADEGFQRQAGSVQAGSAADQRASIQGGESEASAGQDPGPMTRGAALRLVRAVGDQPEQVIRGLLWAHRPPIAWWNNESFPGGNW